MKEHPGELGAIAHHWLEVMRKCGDEVRELLHDGRPVACLGDGPVAYVNVFTSHVNVGFFHGAALPDPARLLQDTGKLGYTVEIEDAAIRTAFRSCLNAGSWNAPSPGSTGPDDSPKTTNYGPPQPKP